MTPAYDEVYLRKAGSALASMLDFAVRSLHQNAGVFMDMFISSGVAGLFATGDVRTVAGRSGIELAYLVMDLSGVSYERQRPQSTAGRSKESLCGEVLANVQWRTSLPFEEILQAVPLAEMLEMCDGEISEARRRLADAWPPLPEAARPRYDTARLINELLGRLAGAGHNSTTRLKQIRLRSGLSQSQLADLSGVPVRTIQQYEQRQKNINKAQSVYLIRLASSLHCDPASLLEPDSINSLPAAPCRYTT